MQLVENNMAYFVVSYANRPEGPLPAFQISVWLLTCMVPRASTGISSLSQQEHKVYFLTFWIFIFRFTSQPLCQQACNYKILYHEPSFWF